MDSLCDMNRNGGRDNEGMANLRNEILSTDAIIEMEPSSFREMDSMSNHRSSSTTASIEDTNFAEIPPPSYTEVMRNDSPPPNYSESFFTLLDTSNFYARKDASFLIPLSRFQTWL